MSELPKTIGRPATSALAVINITQLEQLTKMTKKELLSLHGVGPKAARLLDEALAEQKLSFKQD